MQISESEGRFSVAEKRKFVNLDIRVVLVNVESESNRPLLPCVDAVTLSNAPEEAACAIAAFLGLANACVGLVLIDRPVYAWSGRAAWVKDRPPFPDRGASWRCFAN